MFKTLTLYDDIICIAVNRQTIYSLCGCQLNISGDENSFCAKIIWQALSYSYITLSRSMISLLLHKSEAKLRTSVNNKDIL